ncbi:MAG TPA: septal ring lytic transglycosylase RlpA family protein [Croceibacterium sp.]|nr:septal ring lytic transglycosylase RlpA family protein [Croceibacterium sp.]
MDGNTTVGLRIALAAVAVLGLGGALAPTYAEDTAPAAAIAAATPIADPALPRFEPQAQDSSALAAPETDTDSHEAWEPVGSGMASWYGAELAGHRTASGERFNPSELTAAHRTLPLGSRVRVTYQGESVVVRINDRGPFSGHRVIDLSKAAAEKIGLRRAGSGRVTLAVLDDGGSSVQ